MGTTPKSAGLLESGLLDYDSKRPLSGSNAGVSAWRSFVETLGTGADKTEITRGSVNSAAADRELRRRLEQLERNQARAHQVEFSRQGERDGTEHQKQPESEEGGDYGQEEADYHEEEAEGLHIHGRQ